MSGAMAPAGPRAAGAARSDHLVWVIRSEWTKLWSLRSTGWTLLATVVVTVGVSVLFSWAVASNPDNRPTGPLDVTEVALAGSSFGQLPIAVLGVLVITGEYASGSIRSTLAAVPGRLRLLTAKAVVITVVGLLTGIVAAFSSFFLGMAFFDAEDMGAGLGEPHVLRAVIGTALLLTACGLFGLAIGILLRHTAPAITVSVGLLFLVPTVLLAIPADLAESVNRYFLSAAGDDITMVVRQPDTLEPWQGFAVFVAEIALLLVIAAAVMTRRDE